MRRFASAVLALAPLPALAAQTAAPEAELSRVPVVLLVDSGSGQTLYARRETLRFVPASVTKVMTAWVAFELMAGGRLAPGRIVDVRPETAREWAGKGTRMDLAAGEQVRVEDLLRGVTTASANDASVVLAEGLAGSVPAWTAMMNAQARRLGMRDSHFHTPNGWPDEGQTWVSARDLVTLGDAMVTRHPVLYRRYFGQPALLWNGRRRENHDPITGVLPGADGIKTGYTREAGFNFLGSAVRDGRRLFVVIAGAPTAEARAGASRALLEWGFAAWRARPLYAPGSIVGKARVQGGAARSVPLRVERAVSAAVPAGQPGKPVSVRIVYQGPLVAPVARGTKVAELEIVVDGTGAGRIPLVAAADVAKAGPLDRLLNGVMGLVS